MWNRFPVPGNPWGLILSPNGWNRTVFEGKTGLVRQLFFETTVSELIGSPRNWLNLAFLGPGTLKNGFLVPGNLGILSGNLKFKVSGSKS